MKQSKIKGIPVWYFPLELDKQGDMLIKNHLKNSDMITQFNTLTLDSSEISINYLIDQVKDMKLTPKYIHVYPHQENTISFYVNFQDEETKQKYTKLSNKQRKERENAEKLIKIHTFLHKNHKRY